MFNHILVGTNDIARAQRFYDAVLGVLGAPPAFAHTAPAGHRRIFYRHAGAAFCVSEPLDGEPATVANGATIGFRCESPEQVQAFHDAAVNAGGTSIEDPPGERRSDLGVNHVAYVRDPDGHKLCAIHRVKAG